jgi:uncharacterized phiE125 gp8 family phage protein
MPPILLSGPAIEPLSLQEAKNWLRIDTNLEDTLVQALVTSARVVIEAHAGVQMITQSWRIVMDRWPQAWPMPLPLRPLISVEAVRIIDDIGAAESLPSTEYILDLAGMHPRLHFSIQPPPPGRPLAGIEIDVISGFGPAAMDVPEPLRQAVRVLLARWYENRGDAADDAQAIPKSVAALVSAWRSVRLT